MSDEATMTPRQRADAARTAMMEQLNQLGETRSPFDPSRNMGCSWFYDHAATEYDTAATEYAAGHSTSGDLHHAAGSLWYHAGEVCEWVASHTS